jgi:hypothetical protein
LSSVGKLRASHNIELIEIIITTQQKIAITIVIIIAITIILQDAAPAI